MDTGDGHRFSLLDKKPVHAILLIFKQVKHQYNLQYFSYHHHYNNEHYISKFWQVRNLRLPFHYLPKFTFWQVCSLVVFVTCQNLILASMFVGRVCLSVCLFVCLFVRKFHKISRTNHPIITRIGQKQALVHDSCKFV